VIVAGGGVVSGIEGSVVGRLVGRVEGGGIVSEVSGRLVGTEPLSPVVMEQ